MSVSKESQNRKRKNEESETEKEENNAKRILLAEFRKPELLDLADEILMEIATKLDGETLYNVSM